MERKTWIGIGVGLVAMLALCVGSALLCVVLGGVARSGRGGGGGGGAGGLEGLWGHREGTDWTWYAFSSDGYVFEGIPPGGIDHWRPSATQAREQGTYAVQGGRLIITRAGAQTLNVPLAGSRVALLIDGDEFTRLDVGYEDVRLSGTYEAWSGSSGAGASYSSSTTLRFAASGTFETESAAMFSSTPDASGVHTVSGGTWDAGVTRGRWQIDGSTLTLTAGSAGPRRYTLTMDPTERERPELIRLDDVVYLLQP